MSQPTVIETAEAAAHLAPKGPLRAAINIGNPVLAHQDRETGELSGVTVDIARELARRIDRSVEFVVFDTAGKVAETASADVWDIAFLAIDPKRANAIDFTAAYVLIEGAYLVQADSQFRSNDDVDQPGVRIAAGNGSAYELYLSRTLKHAELVRTETSQAAVDLFASGATPVLAGVRQPLVAFASEHPSMRLLPGRFMAIQQAMGTPKGDAARTLYLKQFVEDLKASGFVAEALMRHHQVDALVAPAVAVES